MKDLFLLLLVLTLGGCFGVPTKDDAKEIATVSATALGESVAKQVAVEVKKALDEGGITKEKIADISKSIADKSVDAVMSAVEKHLKDKQEKDSKDGVPSPAWVGIALFLLTKLHDFKRDGFLKKTPIDVNGDGVIDEKDEQKA